MLFQAITYRIVLYSDVKLPNTLGDKRFESSVVSLHLTCRKTMMATPYNIKMIMSMTK